MNSPVLTLSGVCRSFRQGRNELDVLSGVDLEITAGEIVALVGPSGSGKSTLLYIAGLLEAPDMGDVTVCGEAAGKLDDNAKTRLRRHNIGFVYQYHHLLAEFTALENVVIPQIIAGLSRKKAMKRGREMLGWLGLTDRADHRPGRLSGGEQQRVAIGRALANAPKLLLADEPTGNLDPHTAAGVFEMMMNSVRGAGLGALIATHNPDLAARLDRIIRLEDGHIA
ncbi:MAG TPA: ABC transporter ATP-binding protein [Alphaproteobacteria bacterium]|nr:ABC transporter ATP-binding protein [Alphaproteobacteria bacterium]